MEEGLIKAWHGVCDKQASKGYGELSEWEKVWLDVRALIDSINNGGTVSYFCNSYADHINQCLEGLEKLGAFDVRAQLLEFCSLFCGSVPATTEARNSVINGWADFEDKKGDEVDDEMFRLLPQLEDRLDEFVRRQIG